MKIKVQAKIFVLFLCIFGHTTTAIASGKLDPFLDVSGENAPFKAQSIGGGTGLIDVFIKTSDVSAVKGAVNAAGGFARIVSGDVITAGIPNSALAGLADMPTVEYIEASKPADKFNDMGMEDIGAVDVHSGTGLSSAFTGRGVIVGVIDTGLDYKHADFLDADGNSRVLAIWDQLRDSGPGPAEIENSYGTECLAESIIDGTCILDDVDGHGTHIAGTLAGRHETYGGVAPDANIIAVTYDSTMALSTGYAETFFSTKICEAAYYVFAKAEELGMPAVVNLSLGTHIGAHDGTSLFEQCLEGLLAGSKGRAIVASAGNETSNEEYFTGIHAGGDVDGTAATNFVIRATTADNVYFADIWGNEDADLTASLAVHMGGPNTEPVEQSLEARPGEKREGSFLGDSIGYIINATETASPQNGKQHIGIVITLDDSVKSPHKASFDIILEGAGHFDAWLYPTKPYNTVQFTAEPGMKRGLNFVAGDSEKGVALPATAKDIIAVTGYTTRNEWEYSSTCCGVDYAMGELLDFSSRGPSADPGFTGVKPQISAPGAMVASALSGLAGQNPYLIMDDGRHSLQAGTSMAAPFVAGTAALIFSIDPDFTHEDIEDIILSTARADAMAGATPNPAWGYGKLDAFAAVEKALGSTPSDSAQSEENFSLSGGNSGGGCSFMTEGSWEGNQVSPVLFALTFLFWATIYTRRGHFLTGARF